MIKYGAALLMVLALAGVAWAVSIYVRAANVHARPVTPPALVSSAPIKAVDDALRQVRGLDEMLARVEGPRVANNQVVYGPLAVPAKAVVQGAQVAALKAPPPVISLVYTSSQMKRVVIDGQMLGVGDRTASGARVIDIGADEIVLDKAGRRETLAVPKGQRIGWVSSPDKAKSVR